jgi:type IV secretory pathway VirJ component
VKTRKPIKKKMDVGVMAKNFVAALVALMLLSGAAMGQTQQVIQTKDSGNVMVFPAEKLPAEKTAKAAGAAAGKESADAADQRPLVLLFSPRGGWTADSDTVARQFNRLGYEVAGVNSRDFLADPTSNFANGQSCSDLRAKALRLAAMVGQRSPEQVARGYRPPILAGVSGGATVAQHLLRSAPSGQFGGGIGLSYCPNLRLRDDPCEGDGDKGEQEGVVVAGGVAGGVVGGQVANPNPWLVVGTPSSDSCQVLDYVQAAAQPFANSRLLRLDSVQNNWMPLSSWRKPLASGLAWLAQQAAVPNFAQVAELESLPLLEFFTETPATPAPNSAEALAPLVLVISDLSGWTGREQALAKALNARGAQVVGLDWLRYLWTGRQAEQGAIYLERTMRHYMGVKNREQITLVGFGAGASAAVALVNRLPAEMQGKIQLVTAIDPAASATIASPLQGWGSAGHSPAAALALQAEGEKLARPLRCFAGVTDAKGVGDRCAVLRAVPAPDGKARDGVRQLELLPQQPLKPNPKDPKTSRWLVDWSRLAEQILGPVG